MERSRDFLRKLLRRGVDRGMLPVVLDEELGVALLLGPMMYRHIFGSSVDREWLAEGAVNSFWKAHARPEFQEHAAIKRAAKGRKRDVSPEMEGPTVQEKRRIRQIVVQPLRLTQTRTGCYKILFNQAATGPPYSPFPGRGARRGCQSGGRSVAPKRVLGYTT